MDVKVKVRTNQSNCLTVNPPQWLDLWAEDPGLACDTPSDEGKKCTSVYDNLSVNVEICDPDKSLQLVDLESATLTLIFELWSWVLRATRSPIQVKLDLSIGG